MRKYAAELIGTFCLVFAGTGAIIVNDLTCGMVTHVGVALTFGLIVLAMIYSVGEVSGAHLNPAVTLGFLFARRFPIQKVVPYLVAQATGAFLASLTLQVLFPDHGTLGSTIPAGPVFQSFLLELIMTFLLMFVILSVTTGAKESGILAGVAIGGVIALEALFGGPISGASMNPIRSLAPAVVSGHIEHLWIYLSAPIIGSLLSLLACRCVQEEGCCCGTVSPEAL